MRPLRPRPVLSQSALNDLAVLTTAIGLRHGWSSPPSLKHITIAQDPLPTRLVELCRSSVFGCRALIRPAGSSRRASWCSAMRLSIIWADDLGGNRAYTVEGAPCPEFGTGDPSHLMLMTSAATRRPERSTPVYLLTAECCACSTAVPPANA